MNNSMFEVKEIPQEQLPLDILLLADPEEAAINAYRARCRAFAVFMQGRLIAATLIEVEHVNGCAELFNIATYPEFHGRGFGGVLLDEALTKLTGQGIRCVELGTGTFGYQLSFYQKHGFRVDRVVKNFFVDNYDEPIFEDGIQHRDILRLIWQVPEFDESSS
ncbi:putative N-acetyltransferase YvbK [Vibrio thalassae]|uniref:Putative N-acetyltransferase YvbK n=2 Tax=Vibrio thalassae TaxID=1243014 RepID=A0A240EM74_9VIBR|nr:GNAT family N-acetyltransferase [Vibrio thalassae]SNX49363.1 putative N-acetyltransferase YvbK [Vibrio thalassae]